MSTELPESCPGCSISLRRFKSTSFDLGFCPSCRFPLALVGGRYRLIDEIAEGGFGKVYEGLDLQTPGQPKRAIKFIKPEMFVMHDVKHRFDREVRITSMLAASNEHIVKVFDEVGDVHNMGHYYVMELLEGITVRALLDRLGRLQMPECAHIFLQLCDAMKAAHEAGVVHRDLKPDNLCLVTQGSDEMFLKVLDFGIAKPLAWPTESITNGTVGTPHYMSPEQCLGKKVGPATDIYAMGIILYELLTGRTPFAPAPDEADGVDEAATPMRIIYGHIQLPVPPLSERMPTNAFLPGLQGLLDTALHKEAAQRFDSVLAFEHAFRAAIGDVEPHSSSLATLAEPVVYDELRAMAVAPTLMAPGSDAVLSEGDNRLPTSAGSVSLPEASERGATLPMMLPNKSRAPAAASTSSNVPLVWWMFGGLILGIGLFAGVWIEKSNTKKPKVTPQQHSTQKKRGTLAHPQAPNTRKKPGFGRQVKGCPQTPYHWTFLALSKAAQQTRPKLSLFEGKPPTIRPAKGSIKSVRGGFCVGIKSAQVGVSLSKGKGKWLPCLFGTWRLPKKVTLHLQQEGGLEPEDKDYCLQGGN